MTMMVHDKFNKETQVQNCSKAVNCNGLLVIVIFNGDQKKPSVEAYTGNNVTQENTYKPVNSRDLKLFQALRRIFVSVGLLLQDGSEMEANLGIKHVNYKGTIMHFRRSERYGLYDLHESKIQHKPVITTMFH